MAKGPKNPNRPSWSGPGSGRKAPDLPATDVLVTVSDRLKTIIGDIIGCEEGDISLDSLLREDLGLDSLDLTEVFMQVEEQLGESLREDYDFEKLRTFGDLLLLVTNMPADDEEGGGGGDQDAPLGSSTRGGAL